MVGQSRPPQLALARPRVPCMQLQIDGLRWRQTDDQAVQAPLAARRSQNRICWPRPIARGIAASAQGDAVSSHERRSRRRSLPSRSGGHCMKVLEGRVDDWALSGQSRQP